MSLMVEGISIGDTIESLQDWRKVSSSSSGGELRLDTFAFTNETNGRTVVIVCENSVVSLVMGKNLQFGEVILTEDLSRGDVRTLLGERLSRQSTEESEDYLFENLAVSVCYSKDGFVHEYMLVRAEVLVNRPTTLILKKRIKSR